MVFYTFIHRKYDLFYTFPHKAICNSIAGKVKTFWLDKMVAIAYNYHKDYLDFLSTFCKHTTGFV